MSNFFSSDKGVSPYNIHTIYEPTQDNKETIQSLEIHPSQNLYIKICYIKDVKNTFSVLK